MTPSALGIFLVYGGKSSRVSKKHSSCAACGMWQPGVSCQYSQLMQLNSSIACRLAALVNGSMCNQAPHNALLRPATSGVAVAASSNNVCALPCSCCTWLAPQLAGSHRINRGCRYLLNICCKSVITSCSRQAQYH